MCGKSSDNYLTHIPLGTAISSNILAHIRSAKLYEHFSATTMNALTHDAISDLNGEINSNYNKARRGSTTAIIVAVIITSFL